MLIKSTDEKKKRVRVLFLNYPYPMNEVLILEKDFVRDSFFFFFDFYRKA